MATTTPNLSLTKPALGEAGWGTSWNGNADALDSAYGQMKLISEGGNIGSLYDTLVKIPLRRQEEVNGAAAALGSQYSGAPAVSRASMATYIHPLTGKLTTAAINEQRFERAPDGAIAALIEGASTNLLNVSEFTSAGLEVFISGDTQPAPDGTTTADIVTESTVNNSHYATPNPGSLTISSGVHYTLSVFVTPGTVDKCRLRIGGIGGVGAWADFDLTNLITSGLTNALSAKIEKVPYPANTYRISMSALSDFAGAAGMQCYLLDAAGNSVYAGTGRTLALWGWQMESFETPTSYIKCTTVPVTRSADAGIQIPSAGNITHSGDWTMMVDAKVYDNLTESNLRIMEINGPGTWLRFFGGAYAVSDITGNSYVVYVLTTDIAAQMRRIAVRYVAATATMEVWVDGVMKASSVITPIDLSAATIIKVGTYTTAATYGHFRNFRIYDRALSQVEMMAA